MKHEFDATKWQLPNTIIGKKKEATIYLKYIFRNQNSYENRIPEPSLTFPADELGCLHYQLTNMTWMIRLSDIPFFLFYLNLPHSILLLTRHPVCHDFTYVSVNVLYKDAFGCR